MTRRGSPFLRRMRRRAWNTQRVLGDVDAALQGPGAYARRRARARFAYRPAGRALNRALRRAGFL